MKHQLKEMKELHEIREANYEETKNMTVEERILKTNKSVEEYQKRTGHKLKIMEKVKVP